MLPKGLSDYKEMVTNNYYYIDKTLFVKEIVKDGSKINLIPRPRRFGKTLNLSMLRYFYDNLEKEDLFIGKKLHEHKDIMSKRGKYPVIYLTLKDIKSDTYEEFLEDIGFLISEECQRHDYLLNSEKLSETNKKILRGLIEEEGSNAHVRATLKILSKNLSEHFGEKVIILIDEYDTPVQAGYIYGYIYGYYDKIISFMRKFLSAGLKDNEYLEKGVLTGILRVAKESIFSGLNNTTVNTLFSNTFSDKFGFIEEEVIELLEYYNIADRIDEVRQWYNGYTVGQKGLCIYNPWSIMEYVGERLLKAYWVNTSSNDIIQKLITRGDSTLKKEIGRLINGELIEKNISENIVYKLIEKENDTLWSLLVFSGYLTVRESRLERAVWKCKIGIPNNELLALFEEIIGKWFTYGIKNVLVEDMLTSLTTGNMEDFRDIFKGLVDTSFSYFDTGGNEPERFYHAFVLGLMVNLQDHYIVKSNRESGTGRYDVMLIPNDKTKLGIVFEFKSVRKNNGETIESRLEEAMKQLETKNYKQELISQGVKEILGIGMSFLGKEVKMGHKFL